MTTDQFNQSVNAEIKRMMANSLVEKEPVDPNVSNETCDINPLIHNSDGSPKWENPTTVMQRGDWCGIPYKAKQVCSAGEWPEDMGGNWTPDRIEANYAFSDWLDQQGDSLQIPTNFSDWIASNNDGNY